MEESKAKECVSCAGCLNNIGEAEYVSALSQDWHKDCFRCSVCDAQLSTWYFEKGGLLFCQNDYWARYGDSCQQCAQVITGPVMLAGTHRFHPECFACVSCAAHIEDGQPYALLERSHLYCGSCYNIVRPVSHCIYVVEVPPGAVKVSQTSNALTVTEIDSTCGLLTLHIGDKILEINGTPTKNTPLGDVERALATDAVIQLTIEHTPELQTKHSQTEDNCNSIHTSNDKDSSIKEIETTSATEIPRCYSKETERDNKNERLIKRKDSCNTEPERKETGQCAKETERSKDDTVEREGRNERLFKRKDNVITGSDKKEPERSKDNEREREGRRERLFKRKGGEDGGKWVNKRRQTPSSPLLGKEKSSSMSKLLDAVDNVEASEGGVLTDLSRCRSFRVAPALSHTVFRASDLIQGELLGSGFFGCVYKVTHRCSGDVMVLKQLYRVDEEAQRNFLKEVAVLRSLHHVNVLRFIGVVYKDKRLHLVTEYVAGGTLHQLLQDGSELSWWSRARLARDVSAGVGYLHRMNVIHRDLNSHNCLVREDKTVVVADFGLARIVQRTASSSLPRANTNTLRRKRYTVVGNPYWMAPEMMNGNLYDEKVDVFSFGIILCEIIGRVSADPDFLPRRSDFGLHEAQFVDKFCAHCPEAFYRIAFLACHLEPDTRPPFEVLEIWLESIVMHLSKRVPIPDSLLADIKQYARTRTGHVSDTSCSSGDLTVPDSGVLKSNSNATLCGSGGWVSLHKCVSATHVGHVPGAQPGHVPGAPPGLVPGAPGRRALSRSQHALHTPGYILRADGNTINITKVDDITAWLDPLPLKRSSPAAQLDKLPDKTRRVDPIEKTTDDHPRDPRDCHLPAFLRNQSVEGLETHTKHDVEPPVPFCRHTSIPNRPPDDDVDSDSSDDSLTISTWHENLKVFDKVEPKNVLSTIVKKGENLLSKRSSYDVTNVVLRNSEAVNERKIPEVDSKRHNIDYLNQNPIMAAGVKNIAKIIEKEKPQEKSGFFPKTLLSPKLSRLFKPNTAEPVRNKDIEDKDKSRSKFFVQKPASPTNIGRSCRIRPIDTQKPILKDVIKSDIKLANLGKPMTPIFRRHVSERPDFADGRFSYRDRKPKDESKFIDFGRNRIKTPVIERGQNKVLTPVLEKKDVKARREPGISRSNYVSLANLKINGKGKEIDAKCRQTNDDVPVERVI